MKAFGLQTSLAAALLFCCLVPAQQRPASAAKSTRPAARAAAPSREPDRYSAQARSWLSQLTLKQRAAQLVMVPFYGEDFNERSAAFREYRKLVTELRVGGLILLNRVRLGSVEKAHSHAVAAFLNRMQRLARIPLLVGGDFERGASMRLSDTTEFPHAMAFGAANDLSSTRAWGLATAREAQALGFHWVYAPVADVNNNPDNPIINIRSFGEDPVSVSAHVEAFIEGVHALPPPHVMVTAKHFPGHGDTATDSHIGLGVVEGSRQRLDEVELAPFRAAIEAGVDSVMTAHLAVPALENERIPATVSPAVLTKLLREEMGFKGIITTDAMDMQGLSKQFSPGEAAVRAIAAGADLLLIPTDPEKAVAGVTAAVRTGRISRKRLDESVLKILQAKVDAGLARTKYADLEELADKLNTPEDLALAAKIAASALTLVKNDNHVLPLANPGGACYYLLGGNRFSNQGRDLAATLRSRAAGAAVQLLDPNLPESEFEALAAGSGECAAITVFSWVQASAYRGNVALAGAYPAFMGRLLGLGKPVVFVSFGNPYLLRAYPGVSAYMASFSTVPASEAAVVEALFGKAPVRGRLPVTIPGIAALGSGIDLN